ncbi:hypothetical protein SK128_007641 [Halocaridina rubra]|uniref:Uncharacterized protein n=1 Tax=Halocaridina rubra TaxID=373956 RepID=A0AAN8X8R0_HALRR
MKWTLKMACCACLLVVADNFLLFPMNFPYFGEIALDGPRLSSVIGFIGIEASVITGVIHMYADKLQEKEEGRDPLSDKLRELGFDIPTVLPSPEPMMEKPPEKPADMAKPRENSGGIGMPEIHTEKWINYDPHGKTSKAHADTPRLMRKGHYSYHNNQPLRPRRSVDEKLKITDSIDQILQAVSQIDIHGCVRKMVCYLHMKDPATLTMNERAVMWFFSGEREKQFLTNANAPFFEAASIGRQHTEEENCDENFLECPLPSDELHQLLAMAWKFQL